MATFVVKTETQEREVAPTQEREEPSLDGGDEAGRRGDVAVGHAGGVEGEAGLRGCRGGSGRRGMRRLAKRCTGFARAHIGAGDVAGRCRRMSDTNGALAKRSTPCWPERPS